MPRPDTLHEIRACCGRVWENGGFAPLNPPYPPESVSPDVAPTRNDTGATLQSLGFTLKMWARDGLDTGYDTWQMLCKKQLIAKT